MAFIICISRCIGMYGVGKIRFRTKKKILSQFCDSLTQYCLNTRQKCKAARKKCMKICHSFFFIDRGEKAGQAAENVNGVYCHTIIGVNHAQS